MENMIKRSYASIHASRFSPNMGAAAMREYMDMLVETKLEAEQKVLALGEPFRYLSMEEHFFVEVASRCTHPSEIKNHAIPFIDALQKFSTESTEVSTFGKVLKNELPESALTMLKSLKQDVVQGLGKCLKDLYPCANNMECNKLWQAWTQTGAPATACIQVVSLCFGPEDAKHFCRTKLRFQSDVRIPDFIETLFSMKVLSLEFYLQHFNELYQSFALDPDAPGRSYLTISQALELAETIAKVGGAPNADPDVVEVLRDEVDNVTKLLNTRCDTVCYTDCVDVIFTGMLKLLFAAKQHGCNSVSPPMNSRNVEVGIVRGA